MTTTQTTATEPTTRHLSDADLGLDVIRTLRTEAATAGDLEQVEICDRALAADLVVVERMPEQYRASHRAARNWGRYACNGAERVLMSRSDAEAAVADDEDEYDWIVRPATPADVRRYELAD